MCELQNKNPADWRVFWYFLQKKLCADTCTKTTFFHAKNTSNINKLTGIKTIKQTNVCFIPLCRKKEWQISAIFASENQL